MAAANAENGSALEGTGPLETPEVNEISLLETVLSYVPPKDLINARAVARLWRDESLDNFRKGIVYVLDPETESERLLKLTLGVEANEVIAKEKASATVPPPAPPLSMYRFQDKPLKKYKLAEPQELLPSGTEAFEKNRYFWELCGLHVTSLDLNGGLVIREDSFVDGIIWLLRACPNLEQLQFAPVCIPEDEAKVFSDRDIEQLQNMNFPIEDVWNWCAHLYVGSEVRYLLHSKPTQEDLAKMKENLAPNVKSLSITIPEIPAAKDKIYVALTNSRIICNLCRCVFSLLPNLKNLSMESRYYCLVMYELLNGMLTSNNQLIQLETFKYWKHPGLDRQRVDFNFRALLDYLEKLEGIEGSVSLKELSLMQIPLACFWMHSNTFRNVLFRIRKEIRTFNFGLLQSYPDYLSEFCKLDLFNFIFPNLTELTLEFDCMPYGSGNWYFLLFDFSTFRGTPNLMRFRMKYLNGRVTTRAWMHRRLTPEDLEQYSDDDKWYRHAEVDQNDNMEPIVGGVDETFDPEAGTEIVLDKMKEFYFTGPFTTEALILLGKWMKNLKEFAAIFDEKTLSIPFIVWPGTLKKLTVLGASFEGEGINEELISNLREMYPEVEIVVEEQIATLGMDQLALDDDDE